MRTWISNKITGENSQRMRYLEIAHEEHNCALIALAKMLPDIPNKVLTDAFNHCCDMWPYAGVSNKEFNIALRHMGVFDKFRYQDQVEMIVRDFTCDKQKMFIVLIHGHYTVINHGDVDDRPYNIPVSPGAKVYCSWEVISSSASEKFSYFRNIWRKFRDLLFAK